MFEEQVNARLGLADFDTGDPTNGNAKRDLQQKTPAKAAGQRIGAPSLQAFGDQLGSARLGAPERDLEQALTCQPNAAPGALHFLKLSRRG